MHIHFIGIGGIGISALAQFCQERGDSVTGSEMQETGMLKKLREKSIEISIPQKAENIPQNCDLVVYTEAIIFSGTENPELAEAKKRGIPTKTYFEYLGEISQDFYCIAVAGTHGKTTTTGLLTSAFLETEVDPTIFVGSKLRELNGGNFRMGKFSTNPVGAIHELPPQKNLENPLMLVEACEYRNNFQFLCPDIVLLTNAEIDHVDYYKSEEQYHQTMADFCAKAKLVIYHDNDQDAQKIIEIINKSPHDSSELGGDLEGDSTPSTIAITQTQRDAMQEISLSGDHNRANAALVGQLGEFFAESSKSPLIKGDLGGFSYKDFMCGLNKFQGAWRRQEFLGEKKIGEKSLKIFDDYGHHPTEITATLQSFREKFPHQKIGLIFEPHQYSRTREFFTEFLESFSSADFVALHPIYAARDTDEDKAAISIQDFQEKNPQISSVKNLEDAKNFTENLENGDVLLFMGAGVIDQLAEKFME